MALIARTNEYIILSALRNIFVFNTKDKKHLLTQVPEIPRKITTVKNDAKNGKQDKEDDGDEDKCATEFGDINNLTVSPSNELVAVTTSGDKFLFLYQMMTNGTLNLLRSVQLGRSTSVIRFAPNSINLLIADKAGDCSIVDCRPEQVNSEAKWILGHLSIVLDILLTNDLKYIISSDRDEKIRVTNYPLTEVIESYCLGHTEFVTAIELLKTDKNDYVLVSISGDKTLRLWNYLDGNELYRFQLPARGLRLAKSSQNELAVVSFDTNFSLSIIKITTNEKKFEVHSVAEHAFSENLGNIDSIVYESNNCICYSGLDDNNEVVLKRLEVLRTNDQIKIIETDLDDVLNMLKENLKSTKLQPSEDIAKLLKRRIDNVTAYQENKKRRIEGQQTKSN